MTILWSGTCNTDHVNSDALTETTSSTEIDTAWVPFGVMASINNRVLTTPWEATASEFWEHFEGKCNANTSGSNGSFGDNWFYRVYDSSGVPRLKLQYSATNTLQVQVSTDGTTWSNVGSSFSLVGSPIGTAKTQFDIHVKSAVSGFVDLYFNKVLWASVTGDTSAAGTAFQQSALRPNTNVDNNNHLTVAQRIVSTTSTLTMKYKYNVPTGASATNTAWSNDYTAVDEAAFDPTDFIYSTTANQIEGMTAAARSFTGYTVKAVQVSGPALKSSAGPQSLQMALRLGGSDYFSSTLALTYGLSRVSAFFATDPSTSAAWVDTDAAAATLEFGVKSIA